MDAVSAVKFGARVDSVSAVKGMDHEQHWLGLDGAVDHVISGTFFHLSHRAVRLDRNYVCEPATFSGY
jgi:hypothetical protein